MRQKEWPLRWVSLFVVGLAAIPLAAFAMPQDVQSEADAPAESPALDLGRILETARAQNPEIRAADSRLAAALQRPIQERTLPDPTIGVRYHNESFREITFGQSEFSFVAVGAEQEIPFPGKLQLRGEIAERESERERARRDATLLSVLSRVAIAYYDLAIVDQTAALLRESLQTLELMVRQAEARYAVGAVAQQDVLRAALERGAIEERLTLLDRRRSISAALLDALLGGSADTGTGERAVLPKGSALESLQALALRLAGSSPGVRAAKEEVLRSDAVLELAHRGYYPDFAVTGEYTNKDGLLPEWEVGLRLRVPLYYWRRQGPAVREQAFSLRAAQHEQRQTEVELKARLQEAYAIATSSDKLARLYQEALIPQASLTFESALASYQVGRVDFLTTLNAFTALLEYKIREAEERSSVLRAQAEIRPLVGETPLGELLAQP